MEQAMWLARVVLLHVGGLLTARGFGDSALWEALAGAAITAGAAAWSHYARQAAKAEIPPGVQAQIKLTEALEAARATGRA